MNPADPAITHLPHPPEANAPRRVNTDTMTPSQPQQIPPFPTSAPDIMPAGMSTMCPGCAGEGLLYNAPCEICGGDETLPLLSQSSATYHDQYGSITVRFDTVLINGERATCYEFPNHDGNPARAHDPSAINAFQAWLSAHSADARAHTP